MRQIALIVFVSVSACGQTNSAAKTPEVAAQNLVSMHRAWGQATSTPGTTLVLKEASKSGSTIKMRLYATGLPKDQTYTLVTWPVTQRGPMAAIDGITLDADGLAVCAGSAGTCGSPDKQNDPIDLAISPIAGEPVRLGLVSSNQATKAFAKIVPVPLRGEDRGCSVEATLLTPGSELVLIEGSGFSEKSEVTMDSNSEGEKRGGKLQRGSDGKYSTALFPFRQGVAKGTASVTLKSSDCSPNVRVNWGRRN
ncbi:MAG: hypothetical protein ABL967_04240 [Bryobacteraceae bacterium]